MELSDEIEISVPIQAVYDALNNVDILKKCIPGCEELVRKSDDQLEAKVVLKVGPVKARFSGQVTLDASGGPEKFSLSGQGNGGAAGFANFGLFRLFTWQGEGFWCDVDSMRGHYCTETMKAVMISK